MKTLPCVLVIDDDPAVLGLLRVLLHRLGYAPLVAPGAARAVQALRDHPTPVALALLNVHLAGEDGPAALAALRRIDPRLPCCFMTGGSLRYTEAELLAFGAAAVLLKPFAEADLAGVLGRVAPGGERPPAAVLPEFNYPG
jgi:CheY-like chemotaxis protein